MLCNKIWWNILAYGLRFSKFCSYIQYVVVVVFFKKKEELDANNAQSGLKNMGRVLGKSFFQHFAGTIAMISVNNIRVLCHLIFSLC